MEKKRKDEEKNEEWDILKVQILLILDQILFILDQTLPILKKDRQIYLEMESDSTVFRTNYLIYSDQILFIFKKKL